MLLCNTVKGFHGVWRKANCLGFGGILRWITYR